MAVEPGNISVIISVYKNVAALKVVLDGLALQSVSGFEVLVSEDGEDDAMRDFVSTYKTDRFSLRHLHQPDQGWRKNQALNNAIRNAQGSYLVFIDGDCVPHPEFVRAHARFAEPNVMLSGNRVMLGAKMARRLQSGNIKLETLPSLLWRYLCTIIFDKEGSRFEESLYFDPDGPLSRFAGKKSHGILGCNFSCARQDLLDINGFDEDYVWPRVGEDNDVQWRLEGNGLVMKSVRNLAIQYHLHHGRPHYTSVNESRLLFNEKKKLAHYYCSNGINKSKEH